MHYIESGILCFETWVIFPVLFIAVCSIVLGGIALADAENSLEDICKVCVGVTS